MRSPGNLSGSLQGTSQAPKVIVYTSPRCPKCATLKAWLKAGRLTFEEKNLEDSDVMSDLIMKDLYVLSAPALEVGGRVYTEKDLFDGSGIRESFVSKILRGDFQRDE